MASEDTRSLRDELPAQASWMRKLARTLVRDEAEADDLVQEATLAALRNEASVQGGLRPWLAQVTRNFARRSWRDAARRAAREHAAARPEHQPATDEACERLEIQRVLLDELSALEPRERNALVRRYLDGWSAGRIARETGEPAATVRWRLQRGLARMRAHLDRTHGGDGIQWRLALLPICSMPTPWLNLTESLRPLAGPTIKGVLTMKVASQALAAGMIASALGLGVWWSIGREEPARAETISAKRQPDMAQPQPVAGAEAAQAEAPAPALQREELRATSVEPEGSDAAPSPSLFGIRGRCVDERLAPIAEALVARLGSAPSDSTHSSSDGSFTLESDSAHDSARFRVEATGFSTLFIDTQLVDDGLTPLGDIVLKPGGSVRGRVFGPDGAPLADAQLAVTTPHLWGTLAEARVQGPRGTTMLEGSSGSGGRFEIDGVATGPCRVWAWAEGTLHAVSAPVEVQARRSGEEIELYLQWIGRGDRITGIVLSPDGEPMPNAGVGGIERSGASMTTFGIEVDEQGRFELQAKGNHVYDLTARAPDDRWANVELHGLTPGSHGLELRFQEARWIEVSVRTRDGAEIEDFDLRANGDQGFLEAAARELDAEGRARLRVPTQPFSVVVDARGFELALEGPFQPDGAPETLAFELTPQLGVSGHVLSRGQPVGGARVGLYVGYNVRIEHRGYPSLVSPRPQDETTTDEDGFFRLRLRERGTFTVRAEAPGHAAADAGPFELAPGRGLNDLELVLGQGGTLEGRVLVAPGRDPAGVIVALNRGDAFPLTVRSDEDGLFGFEGLMAGPWQLSRGQVEVTSTAGTSFSGDTPGVIQFNCTIVDGETIYQDLDLRDWQPCQLGGVLLVNGAAATDWTVTAWPGARRGMVGVPPSTSTSSDGSFSFSLEEEGPLRLSFTPPAELGGNGRLEALTEISPGPNRWQEDFHTGRISGQCLSAGALDERSLFYSSAPGVTPSCWLPIELDENGNFALQWVPAGRGLIRRVYEEEGNPAWEDVLEVEVRAGAAQVLEIP